MSARNLKFKIRNLPLLTAVGASLFGATSLAGAAPLTSGADFLKIPTGARGVALGESYTAAAADVNALTWNPAGLALLERPEAGYLRLQHLADVSYNFVGVGIPVRKGDGAAVGLGAIFLGVPPFDSTLGLAPAVSASDQAYLLSFAYRKEKTAVGLTAKYIRRSIAEFGASAFGGDLGVLVDATPRLRFGAGVFHLGTSVKFIDEGDPLPTTARVGVSFLAYESGDHRLRWVSDHSYQVQAAEYRGGGGLEYDYRETLFLRGGFAGDHDERHATAGAGVRLSNFQLDYAFLPFGTLGDTHRISALVRFGTIAGAVGGVPPPASAALALVGKSVKLSWEPGSPGAVEGYHLYARKEGERAFRRLTKEPVRATTLTLRRLEEGVSYAFGLTAVDEKGRESRMVLLSYEPERPKPRPLPAPDRPRVEGLEEGVRLTWRPVPGASAYRLVEVDEQGKEKVALTKEPLRAVRAVLRKLEVGKTYRIAVVPVGPGGDAGLPSPPVVFRIPEPGNRRPQGPPAPASVAARPGTASAELSWDPVKEGTGYHVYVSVDGGNTFRRLTTDPLPDTQVKLRKLTGGRAYLFAVTTVDAAGRESRRAVSDPVTPAAP